MIESNIIHAAHQNDVNKLLFLGSSCIYPKLAKQPMAESELLQGTLEPTTSLMPLPKCRDQTVRILQPPVRTRLPLSHADQPVGRRQLPPSNRM
ncbi:GDP-L-fucose synthase [Escherichia coli P0304777.9]|nr:GDP-L-fucose synthase [Escherichia coli P0304777.9]